jgi:YegS/Rv2252/BmrU family lipid kinase
VALMAGRRVVVRWLDVSHRDGIAEAVAAALTGESPEETRVVVAGGDGTVRAVLPALIGSEFTLGILPLGTFNNLAREVHVPIVLPEAIATALYGRPRRVDLGLANGRPFAAMAGMGYDGAIIHSIVPARNKRRAAYPLYVAAAAHLLAGYRCSRYRVTTESDSVEANAWLAAAANTSRYAYRWRVVPHARADDGWIDLCLFRSRSRAQLLMQAASLLAGRHAERRGLVWLRAREVALECDPPVCVHLDGDPAARTPLRLSIAPQSLAVAASPAQAPAAG